MLVFAAGQDDPASLQHQFSEMLDDSQWWSPDTLLHYQHEHLGWILRHARANVPFYRNRLDALFSSNGEIDWDRWQEVPIVTRRDLVEHRGGMQASRLPPSHGPTTSAETSGSSGVAIKVTINRLTALMNNGLVWRSHRWNELDWSRALCIRSGTDPKVGAYPQGTRGGSWGPPWVDRAQAGQRWIINKFASNEELLRFFADHHCSYLYTGPKIAYSLANDARRLGLSVPMEAVLSFGGAVEFADRAIVKEAFGARMIEYYSSKEGAQIAHTCPLGSLHVNAEAVLVEIVDDWGQSCRPGELGRVIVTPFFSTAQPLIRYDQGDLAVAGSTCSCGRSLPVLEKIAGRQFAMFRHPDGRALARVLPTEARDALRCDYMQVAQIGPNRYEVRYVPDASGTPPEEELFVEHFRRMYFDDAEIEFARVSEIPLTPAGKLLEYVNEWQPPR